MPDLPAGAGPIKTDRAAIRKIIEQLPLKPGVDIAVVVEPIGWMLDRWPLVVTVKEPTPRQIAKKLEKAARLHRKWFAGLTALSTPEIDTILAHFGDFALHPEDAEATERAASALRARDRRTPYLISLAHTLAAAYRHVTGKQPAAGRGESSTFVKFVAAIFDAGGIEASASHYGSIAVDERRRRRRGSTRFHYLKPR
jgi:hypothetical protein